MTYLETDKLKPHKDNPRKISFRQVEKLCDSLKNNPEYFEARPIICNSEYVIYAGHGRYKAAKKLGLQKVPVHVMNLPEEKMREIMIRDNVSNGEWDTMILAEDWNMDLLIDYGIEFKSNFKSEDNENNEDNGNQIEGKKGKKAKAKKIITCPHCNKDYEI
jgi:site-specific DNA-methyltransferase (adenine-specific)